MKIVQVCFAIDKSTQVGTKKYSYFTDLDNLTEGQEVVVETRYGTKVAVFMNYVDINTGAGSKATSWIVQKVNFSKMYENKTKELRLQEIRKIFIEKKAMFEERHIFALIADSDDNMFALLQEYDTLVR